MDWLTFKFCVLIWVLCVSKSQSQLQNSTSSLSNQLRSACEDGQPIVPPDQCNNCICFAGQIHCTKFPCPEQDCVNGVDLPQPDACNKCICRRGKVTCSKMICIPATNCAEKQLYPAQNKCNACMCLKGFITCTNNSCPEEQLPTTISTTTTKKPKKKKKKKKCIEGESLPGSKECIECFCHNGRKKCKYICPTLESRFAQEPECVHGQRIPRPDDCNNCICFEQNIHCTHFPCQMNTRIGPECRDDQPVFRPDECNECYCVKGRLECSDLVCIRGSNCVQGQVLKKPDSCNSCKCVEGHILCTNYQCPIPSNSKNVLGPEISSTEVRALDECQEGDIISPLPPPNDCNTCYCMENRILCTMNTCEGSDPEIKGRLKETNEQTDLEIFDKQISVEPFIHMLTKNYEKIPAKLIHTHAYNGFHQEIKVHANHLPKDATKLLRVLATSLDNVALANISQRLLASSNSLSNNHDSEIPLDHQVVKTNSLGEGNVLTNQSSMLITSRSQSNETILVLPNTEPFDGQNSQSVLPPTSKHETIWKFVSSPGSLVFNNNQEINPHNIQEEKLNVYYYDNPPSMFTPLNQNNVIRNPYKFGPPGHPRLLPIINARNTVHIPNTNPQSIYPASNPKSININDGKTTPIFRPAKIIVTPNNNDGQQKQSQSQFIPNLSKYYHVKSQQIPFKPNQNPTLNNKGIQHSPLFLNNPNQPMVAAKQPQFGLKPRQGSVSPLINISNQNVQQLIAFPSNFQINPPLINLSNQKKRISSIANEGSKEAPPYSMVPSFTTHHTNILNPPQIGVDPEHTQYKPSHFQFVPNPSVYYRNEYKAPKIIEVNPNQEQLIPHSKISYKHTEYYNPSPTSSEFGDDTVIPKVRNKTRKYNTTHSHYVKHTTITYVSEYDPAHSANQIVHDPNQHENEPQTYVYEHYLPDQESQELDLTTSKMNYYLNLPNLQLDQNEPQPKLTHYYSSQTTNIPERQQNYILKVHPTVTEMNEYNGHDTPHQFDTYPHSPSDGKNTNQIKSNQNRTTPTIFMYPNIFGNYPHSSSQPQFIPSQDYSKKSGGLNYPKSPDGPQSLSNSTVDPTHPKSNEPSPSQTGHTQNQHRLGVFDDRGSTNGFQYAHNAYEDPRQLKAVHKLLPSKLETPQNHQLPGFFYERGSADDFQYPSNSAEDPTHPKSNEHLPSPSQTGHTQNQHPPGVFDDRGSTNGFQYAHDAYEDPRQLKPVHKLLPSKLETPQNHQLPGFFDERGSADGFQYPSNSAEDPTHPKSNEHLPSPSQTGHTQNQHPPGVFDDRGSTNGFQYAHNAYEDPRQLKPVHKLLSSKLETPQNHQLPGFFDERGSADGFQYPSNSAEDPTHPKSNEHLPSPSQTGHTQNQHPLGVFDDRGSTNGFQYAHNAYEDPRQLKAVHKLLPSKLETPQNHQLPGFFDERGSADGFQYPSNSAEDPTHSKSNEHLTSPSQTGHTQNQHPPGVFDDRGSTNGFQYVQNAYEDPRQLKPPVHKLLSSKLETPQNHQLPGFFDERGSADGFQYPSNSADDHTHPKVKLNKSPQFHPYTSIVNPEQPKDNIHISPHSQFGPAQNQLKPGLFDNRGVKDGFQYAHNADKNPTHLKPEHKLLPITHSHTPFGPTLIQHSPGIFDERASADGFQYPSNSAEDPIHPKENIHNPKATQYGPTQNQQLPGMFHEPGSTDGFKYPSNWAEKPLHPKENIHKPSNSPFGPITYKQLPGTYPHNFAGNPTHPKNPTHPEQNKQNRPPSQVGPNHNKPTPGTFDGRGSPDGFQYSSNSPENPLHPKDILHYPPHSQFGPPQNHHLPDVFDNRGSLGGFQYPSNSAENPTHPKNNLHKLPQSQFLPSTNQHTPGIFDGRGSTNGFQYPSNSAENPTHPKQNKNIQPNSPFDPAQNQHLPGMFDERGSADGFQYPSNAAENPKHPKNNLHKLPQSQFLPSPNQHTPRIFDGRGSTNGFQYPSNSAENPTHPKQNKNIQPNSPFDPAQNQHLPGMFDERGSADGFQYPSNAAENPKHPKNNLHKLPQSQFLPSPNQHTPGIFDGRGSTNGFQYPSNSAENPTHPKQNKNIQPNSPFNFDPAQNQHLPGMFDESGSADGFQYPSNSAENPKHPKNNLHKLPQSQFLPSPNLHTPGVFDDRGSADGFQYPSNSGEHPGEHLKQNKYNIQPISPIDPNKNQNIPGIFDERGSVDGFQYPSNSVENPTHPKDNLHKLPQSQFLPSLNQHTPGVFDERGSADGFQYPYNSAENPTHTKNNPNTISASKFKKPQNQSKPSFSDDGYNHNNPLRPWMHLDHDQYKPSSFDNLLNGVHNIPWSFSGYHNKDSDTVTSAPKPRFTPDYDQYKPSSFDNLFNGIHLVPWSVPNQDSLGSDAEITTSRSGFKPKQDQYGPSMVIDPSISNQNENIDLTDVDHNQLQIEQDISTPSTDLTDSVSTQYNVLLKLKPDGDPDSLLPTDDGKIPDYYDRWYPLFKAVKKLSDPPIDDSVFSVGSMDQLDLLPFLFPGIAEILNYEPSQDQDDISPDESHLVQRNLLSKLKSKWPENDNGILNWLKNKLFPTKDNATVTKNDIDMTKIFNLITKLKLPNPKDTAVLQNIPFSGFDPEIIENIMNDFKEDTLTTTPRTDSTHTYENRLKSVPTMPEESRTQAPPLKYPDVHILLHQPNEDVDFPPFIQTDGEINLPVDMDSEQLSTSMFPKMFNPRFRLRPKDKKEECGDGTQWSSNCHSCSCYFGQAMCVKLPDCKLRPLGEPMTCKPYSHFKMGCYTCECNGDGVAECDARDCNTQPSGKSRVSGSTESTLPKFHEFYDSKKTNEILQYYNFFKELPKDCPQEDLQTQYPTCERGTSWVSSCHKCECNQSGKHECIKIDDCKLDVDKYGKPGRCKPNSKFYPKMNSMPCVECSCNDEGISYCPAIDYKKH